MNIKKICRSEVTSPSPPTVGRDGVKTESLKGQVRDETEKSENGLETGLVLQHYQRGLVLPGAVYRWQDRMWLNDWMTAETCFVCLFTAFF